MTQRLRPRRSRVDRALRPGAVWSGAADPAFRKRLDQARFAIEELRVRAHGDRGARPWIWVATRNED